MKQIFTSLSLLLLSTSLYAQISIVKNIKAGNGSSTPYPFTTLANGNLLFLADDGTTGYELWSTDGTTTNTALLFEMNPGATGSFSTFANVTLNGKIFYSANDGTHGSEPWITDGTLGGTMMLKDINSGATGSMGGSGNDNYVLLNGKVYFAANDGTNGSELWMTDGTVAGTQIVKNINPAAGVGSNPKCLQIAFGKVFFIANDGTNGYEWWSTDGTTTNTTMLANLNPGGDGVSTSNTALVTMGTSAYFAGSSGAISGTELYSTDGTTVSLVKDINSGASSSNPSDLMVVGGKLYFAATEASSGTELYVTDGTGTGTVIVKNIESGAGNSSPFLIGEMGGKLLFSATTTALGRELWTSDGTTIGTNNLLDINTGAGSGITSILSETYSKAGFNLITNPYISNGKYYFAGDDGTNGTELWVTNGTATGTTMISGQIGVNPTNTASSGLDWILIAGNYAWIRANDGNTGMELFKYKVNNINVPEVNNDNGFSIYPNPSHDNFTIALNNLNSKTATVMVYDMMGRNVYQSEIRNQKSEIALNQPKGVYMVKLLVDDAVMTKQIIIE